MPKVLIADSMSPRAVEIFRERGLDVTVKTGLKAEELAEIIGEFDGLAVRSATKVTAPIIAAAKNLKVIGRAGIGVDTVDVPAATARGIVVMNTPFGNSITTAEHAIAMMFALARQIPQANTSTHAGKWEKTKFMGVELTAKTLGIIGCGNIGSIVAERAVGLRMKVIAFDPFLSVERAKALGVEKVELDELFARADFITLHTPLTNDTRDIINAASLAKMKKGVRIVNCARGGLVVEADLRAALDSGHVAGAAFDVFVTEPAKENVLFGLENVVVTPHLGASTSEAQENVALQIAEQMSDFLLDGAVTNAVNMPSVSADEAPRLTPYMELADQLGGLAGQLITDGITGVTVEFHGEAATINAKPVTASALSGLLAHALEEVNMVSAPVVAKERNIAIAEVKRDSAVDYHTLVTLTVTTDKGSLHLEGTLVAGKLPRITKLGGVALEAELGKHMLYIRNQDKPGFIGALGTLLGDAGVNIATFHLGRTGAQQEAILLTEVDAPISAVLIDKVRRLPQVVEAKALQF